MSEALQAEIAALTIKVRRLEEERAILQTLHRYAHSIDYGREAAWLDCFTEDGAFDLHIQRDGETTGRAMGVGTPHAKGTRIAGRAALEHFIGRHSRAPTTWHKHFMVEPLITLSPEGEHAKVESYFVKLDEKAGDRVMSAFGRYIDDMVRSPDGRWRFRERIAEIESLWG